MLYDNSIYLVYESSKNLVILQITMNLLYDKLQ